MVSLGLLVSKERRETEACQVPREDRDQKENRVSQAPLVQLALLALQDCRVLLVQKAQKGPRVQQDQRVRWVILESQGLLDPQEK